MAAADVYELVEEHFGEPASPDLVGQVRAGSPTTALDFGKRYQEWVTAQKPRIAEKSKRHLRPFIAGAYTGPKGVSLFAPAFSRDEDQLWALYDGLVHHLLYCHSVAIENPLMHLISSSRVGRHIHFVHLQGGMFGFSLNPTIILSRYIALLVQLRDFIDCGAVALVETGFSPMSGYAPHVPVYRESDPPGTGTYGLRGDPYVLSDAQFAKIKERVRAQLAGPVEAELKWNNPDGAITDFAHHDKEESLLRIALGEIVRAAKVSDRVGDLDIYLRNDLQQKALAEALAVAPEWLAGPSPSESSRLQRDMRLLDRLLELDLPDMSNLAAGDIRAIRASDETFNRWRHALSKGLSSIETPPGAPLSDAQVATVRDEIYESIMEAGLAIDTSINKSDVMKAGKAGVLKMIVGLLLSGGAAGPAVTLHAGRTAGQNLVTTAFSKTQQKPLAESINRHTILFAGSV
jgi:hypothetical protein